MSNKKLNTYWSNEAVNILDQKGVRYACISPGSRNAPLVKAFIENKNIKCFSHIDERSNAYFALGIAKKEQEPVVILTTSGTATANLSPNGEVISPVAGLPSNQYPHSLSVIKFLLVSGTAE